MYTTHRKLRASLVFEVPKLKWLLMHLKRSAAYCVMSYSDTLHMTTLILLTPHSGDLDLDQNNNYLSKNDLVLMSKLYCTGNCFRKLVSAKSRYVYSKHLSLKWVQQCVKKKKKLEIMAATMSPRCRL
jgi:hypothetical protein